MRRSQLIHRLEMTCTAILIEDTHGSALNGDEKYAVRMNMVIRLLKYLRQDLGAKRKSSRVFSNITCFYSVLRRYAQLHSVK